MTVDVAAVNCVNAHCTNVLYILQHTPCDDTDERVGVFVLADLSARSPGKLVILGIKNNFDWIKLPKQISHSILKTNSLESACSALQPLLQILNGY